MLTEQGGVILHRLLGMVLTVVLLLCGCSYDSIPAGKAQSEPYNIVWYHINPYQQDTDRVFKEVNKYIKDRINAYLTVKPVDFKKYDEVMKTVIASGEKYDICFTSNWSNNYYENALNGAFVDVGPYIKQYNKKISNVVPQLQFDAARINGRNYAIPVVKPMAHQAAVVFNRKYVEKYGFDISKVSRLEDIEPMLGVIAKNEPDIVPYAVAGNENHSIVLPFDRIIEGLPGAIYLNNSTNYRIINELESEEYKQYLSLMRRWFLAGYIPHDAPRREGISDYEKSGKWFASAATSYIYHDKAVFYRCGYKVDVVPLNRQVVNNAEMTGYMLAVSSTSSNPKKAMEFLELLYTDKYLYNLVTYGIEGVHYFRKSDGKISIKRGVTHNRGPYMSSPYTTGNSMLSYITGDYPLTYAEDVKRYDTGALKSPLLGFWFNPVNVKNEIANLASVSGTVLPLLNTGAVDPGIMLPKVLMKLKEAGLEKVLTEEQRQLDRWLEN